MFCIYQIRNTKNNKIYIGSTINYKGRVYMHQHRLRKNKHHSPKLQNSWNKYGEEVFIFEIIETCLEKEHLILREQHYIDTLKPFFNCNQFAIRKNNFKHTPEAIKKMKISIEKARAEGRFMNETHKQKFLEAGKRSAYGNNNVGKAVYQCTLTGEFIKEYKNVSEAARQIGVKHSSNLNDCALGKRKTAYGFVWKFKNNKNVKSINNS